MAKKSDPKRTIIEIDITPNAEAKARTDQLVKDAGEINSVNDETQCVGASTLLARVQTTSRWIDKSFAISKRPLIDAKRTVDGEQKGYVDALDKVGKSLTTLISNFRKRESDRRAAEAEAERVRREDEARAEQQRRADELRTAASAAPSKKVAKLLNEQANTIASAEPIVDYVPVKEAPQLLAANQHERTTYRAVVHSTERLVLQVAAQTMIAKHGAPALVAQWLAQFKPSTQATMNLLEPNAADLKSLATALKSDLALEGVSVESDTGIVTRG